MGKYRSRKIIGKRTKKRVFNKYKTRKLNRVKVSKRSRQIGGGPIAAKAAQKSAAKGKHNVSNAGTKLETFKRKVDSQKKKINELDEDIIKLEGNASKSAELIVKLEDLKEELLSKKKLLNNADNNALIRSGQAKEKLDLKKRLTEIDEKIGKAVAKKATTEAITQKNPEPEPKPPARGSGNIKQNQGNIKQNQGNIKQNQGNIMPRKENILDKNPNPNVKNPTKPPVELAKAPVEKAAAPAEPAEAGAAKLPAEAGAAKAPEQKQEDEIIEEINPPTFGTSAKVPSIKNPSKKNAKQKPKQLPFFIRMAFPTLKTELPKYQQKYAKLKEKQELIRQQMAEYKETTHVAREALERITEKKDSLLREVKGFVSEITRADTEVLKTDLSKANELKGEEQKRALQDIKLKASEKTYAIKKFNKEFEGEKYKIDPETGKPLEEGGTKLESDTYRKFKEMNDATIQELQSIKNQASNQLKQIKKS